ncbi:unnamed protein product [Lathyrus sativus]|nr:unnamed protein product [Lathyrus sativus]
MIPHQNARKGGNNIFLEFKLTTKCCKQIPPYSCFGGIDFEPKSQLNPFQIFSFKLHTSFFNLSLNQSSKPHLSSTQQNHTFSFHFQAFISFQPVPQNSNN